MGTFISFICVFALFAFVGCFFFSMLMFLGDGTEHPIKDSFKFLGFSFASLFVFVLTLFMSLSPFNQVTAKETLPLNKTFVSFGDGSGLVVDKKPDLAYPLSDEETLINLKTETSMKQLEIAVFLMDLFGCMGTINTLVILLIMGCYVL